MFSRTTIASSTTRPDRDGEAAEGHDVDRDPGDLHDHERREDRERDADGGDQRRADAEQEQEDRQDREERAEAALPEQAVAGFLDEGREVGDDRHARRSSALAAPISSSFAVTASATSTVFAFDVLVTVRVSEGTPSVRAKPVVGDADLARRSRCP